MKYIFIFMTAAMLFTGCGSNNTDKALELLNKADEEVKSGKLMEGLANYEKVMNEYAETNSATDAQLRAAFLYRDSTISTMDKTSRLKKSGELFESFAEKHPEHKDAPNSLFNAGYIYENILMDYGKATNVYKTFLVKYPKHELADDVKLCLDNIGKSPEEMLNQLQKKSI